VTGTTFPSLLATLDPGAPRGRGQFDYFIAQPPSANDESGVHGTNYDIFTLTYNLVDTPEPGDLLVYKQGVLEDPRNVLLDQAAGPTILNIVWTTPPLGGEDLVVFYRTEDA